eukprot:1478194-Alexandrium_andersonii.AAC.1
MGQGVCNQPCDNPEGPGRRRMWAENLSRRATQAARAARAAVDQARAEQRRSRNRQDPWRLPPDVPAPAVGDEATDLGPPAVPA